MHRLTKGNDRRPAAIGLPEVVQGYGVFGKSLTPGCNVPGSEWRDITLLYLSGEKVLVGDNVRCRGMGLGEKKTNRALRALQNPPATAADVLPYEA